MEISIYFVLAAICLFLSASRRIGRTRVVIIILSLCLIVVAAFRGISVGTDTESYYNFFKILDRLDAEYIKNKSTISPYEFLFCSITYIFHMLFNYDLWMLFWYSLFIGCVAYVIDKNSTNSLFSLFLFIAAGFYLTSLNTMRQAVAGGVAMLAVSCLTKEETSPRFWLFALMAVFIHITALIAIPLYFIRKISINSFFQIIIVLVSFVIGFFLSDRLTPYFQLLSLYAGDRFESYLMFEDLEGDRNLINNLGVNILFVVSAVVSSREFKQSIWWKTYFLSMIMLNLLGSMHWMTRLTDYWAISQLIVFPCLITELKNKRVLQLGLGSAVLIYSAMRLLYGVNEQLLPFVWRPLGL